MFILEVTAQHFTCGGDDLVQPNTQEQEQDAEVVKDFKQALVRGWKPVSTFLYTNIGKAFRDTDTGRSHLIFMEPFFNFNSLRFVEATVVQDAEEPRYFVLKAIVYLGNLPNLTLQQLAAFKVARSLGLYCSRGYRDERLFRGMEDLREMGVPRGVRKMVQQHVWGVIDTDESQDVTHQFGRLNI